MARPERFELPTLWFVARYSIQLSYGRLFKRLIIPKGPKGVKHGVGFPPNQEWTLISRFATMVSS